jgi:cytochrome P450
MRTIGMLLGIPEEDQVALRDKIDEGLRLTEAGPRPQDMHDRLIEGQTGVLKEYIEWRAKHPSNDIITELLRAEFEDTDGVKRRLTQDELLGFVNLIAAAGNETTARLIGWMGKVLAEFPDQRAEIVKDPSLSQRAIEELLRYESPSPVQARYVTEDVQHYGQTIKKGSIMALLTASANRDERRFTNPDKFDVRRQMGGHVAFGYGVHFCLGAPLARLEAKVALEQTLLRLPNLHRAHDAPLDRVNSLFLRGLPTLPLHFDPAAIRC